MSQSFTDVDKVRGNQLLFYGHDRRARKLTPQKCVKITQIFYDCFRIFLPNPSNAGLQRVAG